MSTYTVLPSTPIMSTVTSKASTVTFSWSQSIIKNVKGYQVQALTGTTWRTVASIASPTSKTYKYTGSAIGFRVRSSNPLGYSSWSDPLMEYSGQWVLPSTPIPNPGTPVAISLMVLTSQNIFVQGTVNLQVAIIGTSNTAITWASTRGAITGTYPLFTYTAPNSTGTFTITATSVADPTKSASVLIAVAAIPVTPVSVALSTVTNLLTSATESVTVTVLHATNTAVTWTCSGGTITGTGNTITYTAGTTAGTYWITATSIADSTKFATAIVGITAPPDPGS